MKHLLMSLFAASLLACGGTDPAPAAPVPDAEAPVTTAAPTATPAEAEASQPSPDGWTSYGEQFSTQAAISAKALLASTRDYVGKTIKVEGNVAKVCQSMGCWLSFEDGESTITVNMKDHAFSVAKDGAGSWCEAEGTVAQVGEEFTLTAHAVRMKPAAAERE